MQTRSSDENSVCLSVRSSVKHVICDKMEERSVHIFISYEIRLAQFSEKKNGWWGQPLLPEILGQLPPPPPGGAKSHILTIFAHSSSAITPSEKSSINTNRKSTMRCPMSLGWSSYVAPKSAKSRLKKRKTADFRLKSHFAWRKWKSATKFLCVKTASSKAVRHSLA